MGLLDWVRRGRADGGNELKHWRNAWAEAAAAPEPETLARLRVQLEAAPGPEEEKEVEREMLDGLSALVDLLGSIRASGLPRVETGHRAAAGLPCHFSAPCSLPDDPAQPTGRLLMTTQRAVFAGPGQAVVPWHAVTEVVQIDRDIVLVLRSGHRVYRFRCNSFTDALTGACIARQLRS